MQSPYRPAVGGLHLVVEEEEVVFGRALIQEHIGHVPTIVHHALPEILVRGHLWQPRGRLRERHTGDA